MSEGHKAWNELEKRVMKLDDSHPLGLKDLEEGLRFSYKLRGCGKWHMKMLRDEKPAPGWLSPCWSKNFSNKTTTQMIWKRISCMTTRERERRVMTPQHRKTKIQDHIPRPSNYRCFLETLSSLPESTGSWKLLVLQGFARSWRPRRVSSNRLSSGSEQGDNSRISGSRIVCGHWTWRKSLQILA